MNTTKPIAGAPALQWALARGIEAESTNVARASLPKRDPLHWWFTKRKLRVLLERERLLTAHDAPAHQMRRVSIKLAGGECPESDDITAVKQRYECDVRPHLVPMRRSYLTWAVLMFIALGLGAVTYYRVTHRPFDPHSLPAVAFLEQHLSDWTASAGEPGAASGTERLRTPQAQRLLGDAVIRALWTLLESGTAVAIAKPEDVKVKGREFTQSQSAVDLALEQRGLPVFVDATLRPGPSGVLPLVMTYYVERDESYDYQGQPLRAVSGWRIDPMRIRLPALGYVREGNPVAIISYDLIEAVLVLHLLPSLVEKEPAFVFDEKTRIRESEIAQEIERRLGNVLRLHFMAARSDASIRSLGELLAQRRNLIAKWRRTITGFTISPPERLLPERDLGTKLEQYISRTEAMTWQDITDGLSEPRIVSAFERQRDELASAIKRHELQHLIDQKDGLAGIPVALARRLRVDASTEPEPYSLFGAARSELSAYLAQLADAPHCRLSLVQMSTAVFDRSLKGQPHYFAVLALFDGLMKSLRVTADGQTYDEAVVRVVESDPVTVQQAARNLYEEWFGRTLTSAALTKAVERAHWRH